MKFTVKPYNTSHNTLSTVKIWRSNLSRWSTFWDTVYNSKPELTSGQFTSLTAVMTIAAIDSAADGHHSGPQRNLQLTGWNRFARVLNARYVRQRRSPVCVHRVFRLGVADPSAGLASSWFSVFPWLVPACMRAACWRDQQPVRTHRGMYTTHDIFALEIGYSQLKISK